MKQNYIKNLIKIRLATIFLLSFILPVSTFYTVTNIRQRLAASSDYANFRLATESLDSSDKVPNSSSTTPDNPEATSPLEPTDPNKPSDIVEDLTKPQTLWIKAINPGYTVDGVREVGELIELQRHPDTTDSLILLADYSLRYTNASGKTSILYEFPEGSQMVGENLLMRLARSPGSEMSDVTYSTTLAMSAGPLELLYRGEVVDSICWTGKDKCSPAFKSSTATTLVRKTWNDEFEHLSEYQPQFDPDHKSIVLPAIPDDAENKNQPIESGTPHCKGLEFSEIYSYYPKDKSEQFIEIYNSSDDLIKLSGCSLKYKKKSYDLSGQIMPSQYFAYYPAGKFTLTKNPTSSNVIELYDEDGSRLDIAEYYHGQKKSTAYARFFDASGAANWNSTYAPTPNAENVFQEFRSCPAGKVINPETGNCVKSTSAESTLKDCPPGKFRSPITNRCRNISSSTSTQKPCAEGYERNPETNRCRKIKQPNDGADYTLVPTTRSEKSTFIALGIVILLVSVGIIYIILQFRREILRFLRKIRQRFHSFFQHVRSRRIRLHRHKKP